MGEVKPYTLVDDPSAWNAADWAGKEQEFTYELSDADIEEVEAAVASVTAAGVAIQVQRRHPMALSAALS